MTLALDIQPGDVFESNSKIWSEPRLYIVYEVSEYCGLVNIRYLYISGPATGFTYRMVLERSEDWGDTRLF